jgi:hypothetical protein
VWGTKGLAAIDAVGGVYKDKTGYTALRFDGLNDKGGQASAEMRLRFDLPTRLSVPLVWAV